MSKSVNTLALKIALLVEEHTDRELEEAIRVLDQYGRGKALFQYLQGENSDGVAGRQSARTGSGSGAKTGIAAASRAVLKLKDREPEKYAILSEFDRMVRSGAALRTNEALRRFGEQISKTFEPRKSRKESIGAVMEVVADLSLSQIQQAFESAQAFEGEKSDEYQRLAEFIIKGRQ